MAEIFQMTTTYNFVFGGRALTRKNEKSENINYEYKFLQSKMEIHLTFEGADLKIFQRMKSKYI